MLFESGWAQYDQCLTQAGLEWSSKEDWKAGSKLQQLWTDQTWWLGRLQHWLKTTMFKLRYLNNLISQWSWWWWLCWCWSWPCAPAAWIPPSPSSISWRACVTVEGRITCFKIPEFCSWGWVQSPCFGVALKVLDIMILHCCWSGKAPHCKCAGWKSRVVKLHALR